uniref:Uncharacterized protein n=1 Tax=Rhizophora mucronata TaxID=61149 RepID=A0A2P2P9I1_RHIMU
MECGTVSIPSFCRSNCRKRLKLLKIAWHCPSPISQLKPS